jgi:RNA polymerase sigma-70 factor (ECF subfamily)
MLRSQLSAHQTSTARWPGGITKRPAIRAFSSSARRARVSAVDPVAQENMWKEGASAWPQIELSRHVFAKFVSDHQLREKNTYSLENSVDASDSAELFLICACLERLPGAFEAFQKSYILATRPATSRMELSAAMLDDAEQLACEKLFVATPDHAPKILEYVGQGNLAALVRVIVVRSAVSLLRKQKREVLRNDDDFMALPDDLNDPALELVRSDFKKEFAPAFAESLGALSERDRNILRLRFVEGLPIDQISELYQMHRVTASRNLSRIRRSLRDETRSRLGRRLKLTPETLDSFMRLVDSRLDVSIEWELSA